MTISPRSQRPANCCTVKLRWNAAPALNISGRESSSLWLPLNTEIFLPRSERSWRADVLYTPKVYYYYYYYYLCHYRHISRRCIVNPSRGAVAAIHPHTAGNRSNIPLSHPGKTQTWTATIICHARGVKSGKLFKGMLRAPVCLVCMSRVLFSIGAWRSTNTSRWLLGHATIMRRPSVTTNIFYQRS